jgi:N-dimethylarginine dimethylaminohydrolase
MYSVYQHWDPLKVCIVGRSYGPEFYKFIENSRVRKVLERIAIETEEDYQKLITLLEKFGVEVLRPEVTDDYRNHLRSDGQIFPPPMTPRDYSIMLGSDFFFKTDSPSDKLLTEYWSKIKGHSWPDTPPATLDEYYSLPDAIKQELDNTYSGFLLKDLVGREKLTPIENNQWILTAPDKLVWGSILDRISQTNPIYQAVPDAFRKFNGACNTRIGRDVYVGTEFYHQDISSMISNLTGHCPDYRWHMVDTGGHSDGTFCPVKPGLIISLRDIPTYQETFPDWEVVYLPGQSWYQVKDFLTIKQKNRGKWWVPGEELNDDFTNFVESWLNHWVGFVEETVFDVNMLIIDQHNVVCNNYNKKVFDALERHGVTPHIINFRHRYFWDGGLHCITSDIHREGVMQDYFPERQ